MNTSIGMATSVVTAVLVLLLIATRLIIQSYGHRIGADAADFDRQPDPGPQHARYAAFQKVYLIATIVVGLWIIFLGAQMTLSAWTAHIAARGHGARLIPAQVSGALGMLVLFAGIGLIAIQSTLRWDHRPEQVLAPRSASVVPSTRKPSRHANNADFSVLAKASGDIERPRAVAVWYNANPAALWGILVAAILVFGCYLTLFVMMLPVR